MYYVLNDCWVLLNSVLNEPGWVLGLVVYRSLRKKVFFKEEGTFFLNPWTFDLYMLVFHIATFLYIFSTIKFFEFSVIL